MLLRWGEKTRRLPTHWEQTFHRHSHETDLFFFADERRLEIK